MPRVKAKALVNPLSRVLVSVDLFTLCCTSFSWIHWYCGMNSTSVFTVKPELSKKVCVRLTASSKNPVKYDKMNLTNINVKTRSLPVNNEYHPDVVTSTGWGRALPWSNAPHFASWCSAQYIRVLAGFQTNVGKEDTPEW